MARPRVPILSPEKICLAALDQIDRKGDFSIPVLAKELGVSASSMYHHVQGRAGIVNGIRSLISTELSLAIGLEDATDEDLAALAALSWQDQVRRWSKDYTSALAKHPLALPIMVQEPVSDEETLNVYEAIAITFRSVGFTDEQALVAIAVLEGFTFGRVVDAASPPIPWPADPIAHPVLHGVTTSLEPSRRLELAFDFGLEAIITRLESVLEANARG